MASEESRRLCVAIEVAVERYVVSRGGLDNSRVLSAARAALRERIESLERENCTLAERVAAQSELLGKRVERTRFDCKAQMVGTAGGNEPAECNWPFCGCDPGTDKVLSAIEESGMKIAPMDAVERIVSNMERS